GVSPTFNEISPTDVRKLRLSQRPQGLHSHRWTARVFPGGVNELRMSCPLGEQGSSKCSGIFGEIVCSQRSAEVTNACSFAPRSGSFDPGGGGSSAKYR